ncbi:hypothetical protein KHA93_19045 [Bacillus sp. FJAT-49732]|uniref:Uncharacterized protein n=1 Tax=Lederbergia citrisecunda TaxID=2833583 RepID=A0A942TTY5_9BACI|nr:hypothetical protein [Lederbergia citrisecunda]MBS4201704.1 hypothetical protein [Lederbergia citrisecunda]
MKKIFLLLFLCSFMLLTACTQSANSINENDSQLEEENKDLTKRLNDKEIQLKELTQSVEELNNQIDQFNKEKESFAIISNLSNDFVIAHTTGDKERLYQLLSEDITLEERDNKLYAQIKESVSDWLLFDYHGETKFDNWVIQGYQYVNETNTYSVFIREFYSDLNGESVSPPTFLGLTFKLQDEEWKIISLEFDV